MADGGAQILRDMGLNWLECLDEQGVFYFNQVTQQSSDTIPAELQTASVIAPTMAVAAPSIAAPTMAMASQKPPMKAKVLSGGIASLPQVQQQQQVSSYTPALQQVQQQVASYTPALQQVHQMQVASYTPVLQQAPQQQLLSYPGIVQQQAQPQPQHQVLSYTGVVQQQQQASYTPNVYASVPQAVAAAPQIAAQPATQKMAFGDWAVYEDELGAFYMQVSTGVQFETPPPELMQAYQQYRAQQDQIHMQQLQQIELQKQMIDQQVLQQAQSLSAQFGFNAGVAGLPQGYQVA
jgi:hypothetical protein